MRQDKARTGLSARKSEVYDIHSEQGGYRGGSKDDQPSGHCGSFSAGCERWGLSGEGGGTIWIVRMILLGPVAEAKL